MDEMINCGERTVQALHRVALQDICRAHDIEPGDRIEIWIKKVKTKDMGTAPFKRGVDILDEIAERQTETLNTNQSKQ